MWCYDCMHDFISDDGFYMRFPSSVEYHFSLDCDEKSV